jgi:hypothetical protein
VRAYLRDGELLLLVALTDVCTGRRVCRLSGAEPTLCGNGHGVGIDPERTSPRIASERDAHAVKKRGPLLHADLGSHLFAD